MTTVEGLLLAAGAGRRMGGSKALVADPDGTRWVDRAADALLDGGCSTVLVVLGACGGEAAQDRPGVRWTVCPTWARGISASLTHGLEALCRTSTAEAAVIHLVDLPDVDSDVVRRVVEGSGPGYLARAAFWGEPGHPAVVGRAHWEAVAHAVYGDRGAGRYLAEHGARLVECGDLATGVDVDDRAQLRAWHERPR